MPVTSVTPRYGPVRIVERRDARYANEATKVTAENPSAVFIFFPAFLFNFKISA
jgi:hypothetical protein